MAITKGRKATAHESKTLKVGDAAPEISLSTHNGADKWTLSSMKGKNVVLAFYPFAFTPV